MPVNFNYPKRAYLWVALSIVGILLIGLPASFAENTQNGNGSVHKESRFAGPTNVLASFTPVALSPKMPPGMICRCYQCPQKSIDLEGCKLQDVVNTYGAPDKVHFLYYRSPDVQVYTGVEFIYPRKGINFVHFQPGYNESPPTHLSGTWSVDDYECFEPTTLEIYLANVKKEASRNNSITDYVDWTGLRE